MRRVAGHEATALAEAVDHPPMDPERRGPPGVGDHRLGPAVGMEQRLEPGDHPRRLGLGVGQGRHRGVDQAASPRLGEGERDDRSLGREQDRHLVLGPIPGQPDVGQEERLLVVGPLEGQPQRLPHSAPGAVGPDQPGGADLGRPPLGVDQRRRHPRPVLGEPLQARPPLDLDPVLFQPVEQDPLGVRLREHEEVWVGCLHPFQVEGDVGNPMAVGKRPDPPNLLRLLEDRVDDSDVLEHFERPGLDAQRPRLVGRPLVGVDHPATDAMPGQLAPHRQADRPRANDQDLAPLLRDRRHRPPHTREGSNHHVPVRFALLSENRVRTARPDRNIWRDESTPEPNRPWVGHERAQRSKRKTKQ